MSRHKNTRPNPKLVPRGKGKIFQICYVEPGSRRSKRVSTGTSDLREAQRVLAEFLIRWGTDSPGKDQSLKTIAEAYLQQREGHIISVSALRYALRPILDFIGQTPVSAISAATIEAYKARRRNAGRKSGTIRKELQILQAALNWAKKNDLIEKTPNIIMPPAGDPRERWLTREEANALLEATRYVKTRDEIGRIEWKKSDEPTHLYLFTLLGLTTVARTQAILDLTWDRVDFQTKLIDYRVPGRLATNKHRPVVPMNDTLIRVLTIAKEKAMTDHVIEYQGRTVDSIKKGFASAVARAGLSGDVTPHVLRHTGATWLAMAGEPIHMIARLMGHANIQTTYRVYSKYQPDFLRGPVSHLEFDD